MNSQHTSQPSLGINQQYISFTHVTMESDKYICVRETSGQNSVVIVDMATPMQPLRRPITADSVVRILPLVTELRLGIALSLLGAPFFLALLLRMRRGLPGAMG